MRGATAIGTEARSEQYNERILARAELESVLRALRKEGLTPHRHGKDDTFMAALYSAGSPVPADWGGSETSIGPDPKFGVAEAFCLPEDHEFCSDVGGYQEQLRDLAAIGAGRVRRIKFGDALWGSLFPSDPGSDGAFQWGVQVPKPGDLLESIRAGEYSSCGHLSEVLLTCLTLGIKVSLTPFHAGGGASSTGRVDDGAAIYADAPLTWAQIADWHPPHQKRICLPSKDGWDSWYWDWSETIVGTEDERRYEKYAIHVWPTSEDEVPIVSDYTLGCARRKGLGIAAFAQGLAEFLVRFNRALRFSGSEFSIYDVVEFIELGNELDGTFEIPPEPDYAMGVSEMAPDLPVEVESGSLADRGAREAGRYMALLAGPIRAALPQMQFRAAELLSSAPDGFRPISGISRGRLARAHAWLRHAIVVGMRAEVGRWDSLQSGFAGDGDGYFRRWRAICGEGGFSWPPDPRDEGGTLTLTVRDMVQCIGFHWYHCYDSEVMGRADETESSSKTYLYLDAEELQNEISAFQMAVGNPLASRGFSVDLSIGEIAFPSNAPSAKARVQDTIAVYSEAEPRFQASMLVRNLLVLAGSAVTYVYWFNHMLKPTSAETTGAWKGNYQAMGLRNEFLTGGGDSGRFQEAGAFARPAWYSYRRVAWLLSHARRTRVIYASGGVVAIRVAFRGGLRTDPFGTLLDVQYKYAWVFWVDQFAGHPRHHIEHNIQPRFTLFDIGESSHVVLSLVPDVTEAGVGEVDANGYRASIPDWEWTTDGGWDGAVMDWVGETVVDGVGQLAFTLGPAAPTAMAPLCILCNAANVSVS